MLILKNIVVTCVTTFPLANRNIVIKFLLLSSFNLRIVKITQTQIIFRHNQ